MGIDINKELNAKWKAVGYADNLIITFACLDLAGVSNGQ